MATLQSPTGASIELLAHHLVGRAPSMHLQLTGAAVSAQHAALFWTGAAWAVRDLGSRNGTWLNGRKLPDTEPVRVAQGATVCFGAPFEAYTLVDAAPPVPSAQCDDRIVRGEADQLALPSAEEPDTLVLFESDSGWMLHADDVSTRIQDGATIEVRGESWTVWLPTPLAQTEDASQRAATGARLSFKVSSDEEYVEVTVQVDGVSTMLKPRAHHYALLLLARERLDDRASGRSLAEEGWLQTAHLAKQMRVTTNGLYIMLHRARKELSGLGAGEPYEVIERRTTTQQLRLGLSDLEVGAL